MRNHYLLTLNRKGLKLFTENDNFIQLIPVDQRINLQVGGNVLELKKNEFGAIKREIIRLKGLRIQACNASGEIRKAIHLTREVIEKLTLKATKEGMLFKPYVEEILNEKSNG